MSPSVHNEVHLCQEVAGAVDDLRLPGVTIYALNKPVQLDDAIHPVKIAKLVCHADQGRVYKLPRLMPRSMVFMEIESRGGSASTQVM